MPGGRVAGRVLPVRHDDGVLFAPGRNVEELLSAAEAIWKKERVVLADSWSIAP